MAAGNGMRSFASISRLPLEKRIAALEALPTGELHKAWRGAWRASPPKGARRRLLMLGIAWQWQLKAEGGLPKPLARRLAALEADLRQRGPQAPGRTPGSGSPRLAPGARLIRAWGGTLHEVEATDTGYRWQGRSWTSLSAIARAITGSQRNGPAFFGLRRRDRP
jgi:Protein of unknown function (DUF2924)